MRSLQLARWRYVSFCLTGPYGQPIRRVAVAGIYVARGWGHANATVHLDLRIRSSDDPPGLRQSCTRRRVVEAAVHHDLRLVLVLEDDFIPDDIHCHCAEGRVRILDCPHR